MLNVAHSNEPVRSKEGRSAPIYLAGFIGTIVAGGLFPAATAIPHLALRPENFFHDLGELLAFSFVGFWFGAFFAAIAAACVFPLVGVIQGLVGLRRQRVAMASIAGGWSGFAATICVIGMSHPRVSGLPILAAAMGQIGAGAFAYLKKRQQERAGLAFQSYSSRFSLRQLIGLTSSVAIVCGAISVLRLPWAVQLAMAKVVALQLVMLGIFIPLAAFRRRRREAVLRQRKARIVESPFDEAMEAQHGLGVSRETIGAVRPN